MAQRHLPPLPDSQPVHWWHMLKTTMNSLISQTGLPPRWRTVVTPQTALLRRGQGNSTSSSVLVSMPNDWEEGSTVWFDIIYVKQTASANAPVFEFTYQWTNLNEDIPAVSATQTLTSMDIAPDDTPRFRMYVQGKDIDGSGKCLGSILRLVWARQTDSFSHTAVIFSTRLLYQAIGDGSQNRYTKAT